MEHRKYLSSAVDSLPMLRCVVSAGWIETGPSWSCPTKDIHPAIVLFHLLDTVANDRQRTFGRIC
jgi:hypothetical protein